MKISVVCALSMNSVIGVSGKLPWRIKHDLVNFKGLTAGKVVIMGRKTWESLGSEPLPGRTNVVISSTLELPVTFTVPSTMVFGSLIEALNYFETREYKEVCIIGGKSLIEEGVKIASNIYITTVQEIIPLNSKDCVQVDVTASFHDNDLLKLKSGSFEHVFSVESSVSCRETLKGCKSSTFEIVHLKKT